MKKLIFVFAVMVSFACYSCKPISSNQSECPSVDTDSVVVDTINADSVMN